MGGPKVDKSALTPLLPFLWNSLIPEFLCLYRQHNSNTNNQRKQKTQGKNSRRSHLHGLSFFHKHKAQMTTDLGPWTCLSSRMLAPLVSVVVGSFLSPNCILVPRDEWVNLSLNIWDLHQKSGLPYCMA